jgi:hypothetical protein
VQVAEAAKCAKDSIHLWGEPYLEFQIIENIFLEIVIRILEIYGETT